MPNQKNIEAVKVIDEKLKRCHNIILVDYAGLSVAEQTEFRKQAKSVGGEMTVQKNSLLALTLKKRAKELPESVFDALNGPTAMIYGYEDAVGVTKLAVEFAKTHEDNFKLKVGVLAGTDDSPHQALDIEALKKLATLPNREELRAKLVGTLNAPISGFVTVLSGNLRGLVQVIKARTEQLEVSSS
jgi:large subunit ribosomal protein L10